MQLLSESMTRNALMLVCLDVTRPTYKTIRARMLSTSAVQLLLCDTTAICLYTALHRFRGILATSVTKHRSVDPDSPDLARTRPRPFPINGRDS